MDTSLTPVRCKSRCHIAKLIFCLETSEEKGEWRREKAQPQRRTLIAPPEQCRSRGETPWLPVHKLAIALIALPWYLGCS